MLGQLYASSNRPDEARDSFEQLVKQDPDRVSVHTVVALTYEMQGDLVKPRKRYEHIIRLDASAAVANNNLAYMCAEQGGPRCGFAAGAARQAEAARRTIRWLTHPAACITARGWPKRPCPLFQQAVVEERKSATYHYHLALAHGDAGDREKACQVFVQVIALGPDSAEAVEARSDGRHVSGPGERAVCRSRLDATRQPMEPQ
jgi:Tfp pilus assembly protein PilF